SSAQADRRGPCAPAPEQACAPTCSLRLLFWLRLPWRSPLRLIRGRIARHQNREAGSEDRAVLSERACQNTDTRRQIVEGFNAGPDRVGSGLSLAASEPVADLGMRRKILHPVRAAPDGADYNEITNER